MRGGGDGNFWSITQQMCAKGITRNTQRTTTWIPEESVNAYKQVWKRKAKYIIFKGNDDYSAVIVDKEGGKDETFDDFKNSVPKDQPRWLLYDFQWKADDGRNVTKTLLMAYSPDDNTDATSKFVIPNSIGALKAKFDKINLDKQVNCWDDLDEEKFKSWFK